MVNRIHRQLTSPPANATSFTGPEALEIMLAYLKDPADIVCPLCGPGWIWVFAFVSPTPNASGFMDPCEPVGVYVAALFCEKCQRKVGIKRTDQADTSADRQS